MRVTLTIVIPILSIVLSSALVCHLLKFKWRVCFPFYFSTLGFSMLVLTPIQMVPVFGSVGAFFFYFPVIDREWTLTWWYLLTRNTLQMVVGIYAAIPWTVAQVLLSPYLTAHWFSLEKKEAIKFYIITTILSIVFTILLTWVKWIIWL